MLASVTRTSVLGRVVYRLFRQWLFRQCRRISTDCIYDILYIYAYPATDSSPVLGINATMSDVNLSKIFSLENKVALVTGGKTLVC
jgi:hypothetical protein